MVLKAYGRSSTLARGTAREYRQHKMPCEARGSKQKLFLAYKVCLCIKTTSRIACSNTPALSTIELISISDQGLIADSAAA